jgi:hypothetical protein
MISGRRPRLRARLFILLTLSAGEHGDEIIPSYGFAPDDRPAHEGLDNTFGQKRNLGGLPFSKEVIVGLITIVLRLRKGFCDVIQMIFALCDPGSP